MQTDSITVTSEDKTLTFNDIETHLKEIDQWTSIEYYFDYGYNRSSTFKQITYYKKNQENYEMQTEISYISKNKFKLSIYIRDTSKKHLFYFGVSLIMFLIMVSALDEVQLDSEEMGALLAIIIFFILSLIQGIKEKKSMNKFEKSICRLVKSYLKESIN